MPVIRQLKKAIHLSVIHSSGKSAAASVGKYIILRTSCKAVHDSYYRGPAYRLSVLLIKRISVTVEKKNAVLAVISNSNDSVKPRYLKSALSQDKLTGSYVLRLNRICKSPYKPSVSGICSGIGAAYHHKRLSVLHQVSYPNTIRMILHVNSPHRLAGCVKHRISGYHLITAVTVQVVYPGIMSHIPLKGPHDLVIPIERP